MRFFAGLFLCLIPLFSVAESGFIYAYQVRANSWIALSGTTNVNSFTCTSSGDIPDGYLIADILPGSNAVFFSDASLNIKVSSFDCKNRIMSNDLHEAMGGSKHPIVSIRLKEIRPQQQVKSKGKGKLRAEFAITLNGVTRDADIIVDYHEHSPLNMLLSGSKDFLMSDFGIDPPSPAMGFVKVRDKVSISFHLLVETSLISQAR
jgi:hypothetical protein